MQFSGTYLKRNDKTVDRFEETVDRPAGFQAWLERPKTVDCLLRTVDRILRDRLNRSTVPSKMVDRFCRRCCDLHVSHAGSARVAEAGGSGRPRRATCILARSSALDPCPPCVLFGPPFVVGPILGGFRVWMVHIKGIFVLRTT